MNNKPTQVLPTQAITEFKALWLQQLGEELADEEAGDRASELLELFQVVYQPLKKERVEAGPGVIR